MGKLILYSVLLATIVVPVRAARVSSPTRGLRLALLWLVAFNVLYAIAVVYVWPRVG